VSRLDKSAVSSQQLNQGDSATGGHERMAAINLAALKFGKHFTIHQFLVGSILGSGSHYHLFSEASILGH